MKSPYYIMAMAACAFVCIATASACEETPDQPAPTVGPMERLRTSDGFSDVLVVKDEKREATCYVTYHGISCLRDPIHDDAGTKP